MTSSEALRSSAITVHELLSPNLDTFYACPEFQRHYVWSSEGSHSEIQRFWADFERLMEEGTNEGVTDTLFLGAVVQQTVEPGGPGRSPLLSIIDGQQRLTTLYLVFVAIAEAFQDCGEEDLAADIERQYLLSQMTATRDQPRLRPTISDTNQFQRILSSLRHPKPRFRTGGYGEQDGPMTAAWSAIRQQVRVIGTDESNGQLSVQHLKDLLESLSQRIQLAAITLGAKHDPHEIYERLNTAGVPLKIIDLTRNEVFLIAGQDGTERIYTDHWGPFEERLGIQKQDGYFFPYALIRNNSITKGSMYRGLRTYWRERVTENSRGEEAARAIVEDLSEFLPSYLALVNQARPSDLDERSWNAVRRLHRLGVPEMMYPYLMKVIEGAIQGDVAAEQVIGIVDIIDTFLVRRTFSGITNTGMMPIFKDLWSRTGANKAKVMAELNRRTTFPDDDEFRARIADAPLSRYDRCRYLLTEYERSFPSGDPSEWEPGEITIDHILPRKAILGDWPGVSKDQHETLSDTWANLVPLSQKANSEKSAGNYAQTRQMMLEHSGTVFKSTRAVFDENPTWDAKAIRERAEELADWALQRWPKPS